MLKSKLKFVFFLSIIAILVSSTCFATSDTATMPDANNENSDDNMDLTNWVNDDLYLSDENVVVNGIVDGNVFAIGNTVTINAEIGGDLFVLADTLNINGGYVYSSIFGLANTINIDGIVYDVYAVCDTLNIKENGYIYRDLRMTAKNVSIAGKIRRNAYISASDIQFVENSGASIGGSLTYSSKSELSIPENIVSGEVVFNKVEDKASNKVLNYVSDLAIILVNTLIITLLAIWLTPNFVKKLSNASVKSLLGLPIGLATLIVVPIISVILMFTMVGMTAAFSLLAIYFLLMAFSIPFTSMVLGGVITKLLKMDGKLKFVLFSLLSALVIWALTLIPYVSIVVSFLSVIFAMGIVVFSLFTKVPTSEVKE